MFQRILLLFLALTLVPAGTGCSRDREDVSPEMSKGLLRLRGYEFTTEEFFRAIQVEDPAFINGFIDAGMDPNSKNSHGMTALTFAVQNTSNKTIRVLSRRADINLKDDRGNAPLHMSIIRRNKEAVSWFLKLKADVNVTGKSGGTTNQSPLFAAILLEDNELIKKLLERGADPSIADSSGAFPLSEACIRRGASLDIVKLLIKSGADVNKREVNGASSLIYAAQNSGIDVDTRMSIVAYLLEKGADRSFKDRAGKTALDWAEELDHEKTAELLAQPVAKT